MATRPMHLDAVSVAEAIDDAVAAGSYTLPAATDTALGGVKQVAHQANAAGANPTQAEYDALLAALIAAGVMASA